MKEITKEKKPYRLNFMKISHWKNIFSDMIDKAGKGHVSHCWGESKLVQYFLESSVMITIKGLKVPLL